MSQEGPDPSVCECVKLALALLRSVDGGEKANNEEE